MSLEQAARAALESATDAFKCSPSGSQCARHIAHTITFLDSVIHALAQQETPEPVYFRWVIHGDPIDTIFKVNDLPDKNTLQKWKINGRDIEYLYSQPPRREWVGLNDKDRLELEQADPIKPELEPNETHRAFLVGIQHGFRAGVRAAEAKLKELNT